MTFEMQPFLEPIANSYRLESLILAGSSPKPEGAQAAIYDADTSPYWGMAVISRPAIAPAPVKKLEDLRADFWPDGEEVDEFLEEVRRWRDETHRGLGDPGDNFA